MPTPDDACARPLPAASINASCPPDNAQIDTPPMRILQSARRVQSAEIAMIDDSQHLPSSPDTIIPALSNEQDSTMVQFKLGPPGHDELMLETQSSASSPRNMDGRLERTGTPMSIPERPTTSLMQSTLTGDGFPSTRLRPSYCSSFLRAGSKFRGTQQSDKQIYNVEVTIKNVDLRQSLLCGFLRIEGLTKDHPTLTTCFEGEIIGSKYTFQTKHESWGATEKTDMQHWDRFPAWRPLANAAKKPDFHYKNATGRENIFMRWKESFLVPDHKVREISGASFEGFYYICFNQIQGTISGIYFHARSEKYQQLELKHVEDRGCFGAMEFR